MATKKVQIPSVEELEKKEGKWFYRVIFYGNKAQEKIFCSCGNVIGIFPCPYPSFYRNNVKPYCQKCQNREEKYVWINKQTADFRTVSYFEVNIPNNEEFFLTRFDLVVRVSWEGIEKEVKYLGKLIYKHPHFSRKKFAHLFKCKQKGGTTAPINVFGIDPEMFYGHKVMEQTGARQFLEAYYQKDIQAMFLYLEKWQQLPQIELLLKSGFSRIVFEILDSDELPEFPKTSEGNKLFSLTKDVLKFIKENISVFGVRPLGYIQMLERIHQKRKDLTVEHLRFLLDTGMYVYAYTSVIEELIETHHFTLSEIIGYLRRCELYQAIPPKEAIIIWRDYLNMCRLAGWKPERFPTSLKLKHDLAARDFKIYKDKQKEEIWQKRKKDLAGLEEESDEYVIMLPETLQDLVKESRELRHCVQSYIESLANGKTTILFLRKREDINKPYFTIEVKGGHIVQVRGFCNSKLSDKNAIQFMTNWKKKHQLTGNIIS